MMYQVKMMSKDIIKLTGEEYQKIISSKASGLIFIERLKGSINLNSVESILPEDMIVKKEHTIGRLHDGTKVIKRFREWVDGNNPGVQLSYSHYPELANDTVMSEEEYEKSQTYEIPQLKGTNEMLDNLSIK